MEEKIKELKEKFEGSNKYMLTLNYEDIKELFAIIEILKRKEQLIKTYKGNLPENVEIICLCKNDFERNISDDYISKNKIKAKIDYLLKRYDSEEDFCSYDVLISILKSLLKKE